MIEHAQFFPYEQLQELERNGHARRMGQIENAYALMKRQKLYLNFSMFADFNTYCTEGQLATALRSICLKHPTLLHVIVPETWPDHESYYASPGYYSTKPKPDYITILQKVTLKDIIMNEQAEYLEVIKELNKEFGCNGYQFTSKMSSLISTLSIPYADPSGPTWRLICLTENKQKMWRKFVFVSNHCLSDGKSAAHFFLDLKDELNKCSSPEQYATNIFEYRRDHGLLQKLHEPIENKLNIQPRYQFILGHFFRRSVLSNFCCTSSSRIKRIDEISEQNAIVARVINICPADLESIKQRIKANVHEKCTITPYLEVCWLFSLVNWGQFFKFTNLEWYTNLLVPVDCRPLLYENQEMKDAYRYGANSSYIETNPRISELTECSDKTKFWTLVDNYHKVIIDSLNSESYVNGLGFHMFAQSITNYDKLAAGSLLGKPRLGTLLSNLGMVHQTQRPKDSYVIKDLVFGQFQGSFTHSFSLTVCSTEISGMNITITSARDVIPTDESFDKLCTLFKAAILDF